MQGNLSALIVIVSLKSLGVDSCDDDDDDDCDDCDEEGAVRGGLACFSNLLQLLLLGKDSRGSAGASLDLFFCSLFTVTDLILSSVTHS